MTVAPCSASAVEGGSGAQILAQLHAQRERGHLLAAEQQPAAKRHPLIEQLHLRHGVRRGREQAFFIEFAVVGQVRFGHDAQHPAAAQDGGAVVQAVAHAQRQPHGHEQLPAARGAQHQAERAARRVLQGVLQEQVAAGIARQAQLGQHEQHGAVARGPLDQRGGRLRVVPAVGRAFWLFSLLYFLFPRASMRGGRPAGRNEKIR